MAARVRAFAVPTRARDSTCVADPYVGVHGFRRRSAERGGYHRAVTRFLPDAVSGAVLGAGAGAAGTTALNAVTYLDMAMTLSSPDTLYLGLGDPFGDDPLAGHRGWQQPHQQYDEPAGGQRGEWRERCPVDVGAGDVMGGGEGDHRSAASSWAGAIEVLSVGSERRNPNWG